MILAANWSEFSVGKTVERNREGGKIKVWATNPQTLFSGNK